MDDAAKFVKGKVPLDENYIPKEPRFCPYAERKNWMVDLPDYGSAFMIIAPTGPVTPGDVEMMEKLVNKVLAEMKGQTELEAA